jgi:anti-anti-sigma regulatory factor
MDDKNSCKIIKQNDGYTVYLKGKLDIHNLQNISSSIDSLEPSKIKYIDFSDVEKIDTAVGIYINNIINKGLNLKNINDETAKVLALVKNNISILEQSKEKKCNIFEKVGSFFYKKYIFLLHFLNFIGMLL